MPQQDLLTVANPMVRLAKDKNAETDSLEAFLERHLTAALNA